MNTRDKLAQIIARGNGHHSPLPSHYEDVDAMLDALAEPSEALCDAVCETTMYGANGFEAISAMIRAIREGRA